MQQNLKPTPIQINLIIGLILICYILIGMAVDLIAPSLPAIADQLNVSASFSRNLISIYFLGYALGSFCVGLLSDAYGRKTSFLAGFGLFVLASFMPVIFTKPDILLLARLAQGLGVGSATIGIRGILVDLLPQERILRVVPLTATMWGIGPIIGPAIGGYLQYYFDWQACFLFFGIFSLFIFLPAFVLIPETHFNRQPVELIKIKNNFQEILTHRVFIGSILIMGLIYSLIIVFNVLGPFLIQVTLHHSSVYFGHIAFLLGLTFLLGTLTCRGLIQQQISPEKILSRALPIGIMIVFVSLIFAYFFGKNTVLIILCSACICFISGLIYPSMLGRGMGLFRHLAGNSSAIMNLVNILIVSLASSLISKVSADSFFPVTCIYLGLLVLSALVYCWMIRK